MPFNALLAIKVAKISVHQVFILFHVKEYIGGGTFFFFVVYSNN